MIGRSRGWRRGWGVRKEGSFLLRGREVRWRNESEAWESMLWRQEVLGDVGSGKVDTKGYSLV